MQVIVDDPVRVPALRRRVRDDLIGLRGVAIVLVVVCHFWFGRACGGLDVLLVLSGFFVGGRVLRHIGSARPMTLAAEAGRAARWLVPPLVLVVVVSAVLTVLVQPQTRWEAFADQTLASLGFYQNWQLLQSADDYVQAGEAVTPLHHLWAISALGQFVLAFFVLAGTGHRGDGPSGSWRATHDPGCHVCVSRRRRRCITRSRRSRTIRCSPTTAPPPGPGRYWSSAGRGSRGRPGGGGSGGPAGCGPVRLRRGWRPSWCAAP